MFAKRTLLCVIVALNMDKDYSMNSSVVFSKYGFGPKNMSGGCHLNDLSSSDEVVSSL
jgi:hypothetical protein